MRVLYVCTANICRSASAAQLLRGAVEASPELAGIEVRSAGTAALPGSPGCSVAPALVGHAADHRSQPVTAELIEWADLILPAARDHRPAIVELAPSARSRMFTIRQAGRIADWLMDAGMVAAARARAEASGPGCRGGVGRRIPGGRSTSRRAGPPRRAQRARLEWLLGEMDAARGMSTASPEAPDAAGPAAAQGRRFGLRRREGGPGGGETTARASASASRDRAHAPDPNDTHPDDVPDPHVLGMGLHPLAYEQITASTDSLVRLLEELAK